MKYNDKNFALRLMSNLVTPTFVLNPEGNVIIWNRAMEKLTGFDASEVLGTKRHWEAFYSEKRHCLADVFLEGNHETLTELYESHLVDAGIEKSLSAENWAVMPQIGVRKYLAIDAGPVFDDKGQLIAVVETIRDMTELKNARDELHHLANTDGLTSLRNRRFFDEQLSFFWGICRRYQQPLALLMIDVDHFKKYNDSMGHLAGDDVLGEVAAALKDCVFRPADECFRYGGEEFAVLLADTDEKGASFVADRICEKVSKLKIAHPASPHGNVTVSIGVTSLIPSQDLSKEVLIKRADECLYSAKEAGRNQFFTLAQAVAV